MEVAVKSLGKDMSENERVMFLKEAAIMGQFNHQYIVKILGIIYDEPVSEPIIKFWYNHVIINFCLQTLYAVKNCGGIDAKRGPSTTPHLIKT